MQYEFSTKLNNRKNSAGVVIEKVRVWLEESTNNRFLSDNGFKRGAAVDIVTMLDRIDILLLPDPIGTYKPEGKRAKVAGKMTAHYSISHAMLIRCRNHSIRKITHD